MVSLHVNGGDFVVDAQENELLVWVIHEKLGLTKTRFGCGLASCGACKVRVDGEVVHSCALNVGDVVGKKITTEEADPSVKERQ